MKGLLNSVLILALTVSLWTCKGKDPDPQRDFPAYLRIPATLSGYAGSGRVAIAGGLNLVAEGPEVLDEATKTYTGVSGRLSDTDVTANATFGQPLPFAQSYSVPPLYQSNGQLLVVNAVSPGTYPMGFEQKPSPAGVRTDIILNLPGPQIYIARSGSLTISESTLVKTESQYKLYRVQGTFETSLVGTGTGAKDTNVTATFDLLLVN